MKEIKRALAAVIAAIYMLSAAGCAGNSADSKTDTQNSAELAVSDTENAPTPAADTSDVTAGLVYDETDNTWSTDDENMQKFVKSMWSINLSFRMNLKCFHIGTEVLVRM